MNIPIKVLETGEVQQWPIDTILEEINRDRSSKWTNYDESDWQDGWDEWVGGEFYSRNTSERLLSRFNSRCSTRPQRIIL